MHNAADRYEETHTNTNKCQLAGARAGVSAG